MLKIKKNKMDRLIDAARRFYDYNDSGEKKTKTALEELREARNDVKPAPSHIDLFIMSIVARHSGLNPLAENKDIYRAMKILGYEVEE